MRIRRIRLANYRGVDACDIEFPSTGVTIVHGANEVGKSSLAHAIDLLFDLKDSSKDRRVRAVQPAHRDASPEVTVDAQVGAFEFTYRKQFGRRRRTELAIHAPSRENLTGDAAHDRVRQILESTLDADLWKALRIDQGQGLDPPEVAKVRGIAAALDRAAGAEADDDSGETLVERARAEFEKWYTPAQRRPKQALVEPRRALAALVAECEKGRGELAALEEQSERLLRLERERASNETRLVDAEREAAEAARALRLVDERAAAAELLSQRARAARGDARAALERAETRQRLNRETRVTAEASAEREAVVANAAPEDAQAGGAHDAARGALAAAESAEAGARRASQAAQLERECLRASAQLAVLIDRRDIVATALDEARDAESILARVRIDDTMLKTLEEAARRLETARELRELAAARIEIDAECEVEIELDETRGELAAGEREVRAFQRRAEVRVPGAVKIVIHAGSDVAGHAADVEAAAAALQELLAAVACADLEAAAAAADLRRRADRTLGERKRFLAEQLPGGDPAALDEQIADVERRLREAFSHRDAERPLPSSPAAADAAVVEAASAVEAASRAVTNARGAERRAAEHLAHAREAGRENRTRLEFARDAATRAASALAAARAESDDLSLEEAQRATAETAAAERERAARAAAALADVAPERVRTSATAALAAVEHARRRARDVEVELGEVRAHLRVRGEDGLRETLDTREAERSFAAAECERVERRAAAAMHLYDELTDAREAAHRGYQTPLRVRIEALGQRVFGRDFTVEVDRDLRVSHRTLDGVTLPFESLSTGAQEQISLISRLACAQVAEADGGVPLLLDDTLGNTDPERLRAMGELLGIAAATGQVVVLTSNPERYRGLVDATWIALD